MSSNLLWQTLILLLLLSCNRQPDVQVQLNASFLQSQSTWVDSMLLEMSLEEKIGQLILFKPNAQSKRRPESMLWIKRVLQMTKRKMSLPKGCKTQKISPQRHSKMLTKEELPTSFL